MGAAEHIDTSGLAALELKGGMLKLNGRALIVDFIVRGDERIGHVRRAGAAPGNWRWEIDAYELVGEARSREGALQIARYFLAQHERSR